jgi:hypothetical protein
MKKTAAHTHRSRAEPVAKESSSPGRGIIHPVVIYPFKQPEDYSDLESLYQLIARLDGDRTRYARPITVLDRKTHYAMGSDRTFLEFRKSVVSKNSDVLDAWCVDTCQMWCSGLGMAFEQGGNQDVYWLIPGDFNYGTRVGQEVLSRLHDLPEIVLELEQDICIGEIATDHNNSKHLIDTYGTFALLYNWFPLEAQEIRRFTERPRSEFFAIRHAFLREVLGHRWYPYEQTVVMLLQAVFDKKRITRFFVGDISDLPEGRESLAAAMQQIERTERVLKSLWRERNGSRPGWVQEYHALEARSEQIRRVGSIILENLSTE